jgi:hypothetical protein
VRQKPQVLSVRKNIHRYLPNLTARRKTQNSNYKRTHERNCEQFSDLRGAQGRMTDRMRHISRALIRGMPAAVQATA